MRFRVFDRTRVAWLCAAIILSLAVPVVARVGSPPRSLQQQVKALAEIKQLVLFPTDAKAELAADEKQGGRTPVRYAVAQTVAVTPATDGTWEQLPEGRLWRLRIVSTGATDLNLGFTTFWLPEGATLHVSAETENYFQGPYTAADNTEAGQLWTPVVPGDAAVIELFVPAQAKEEPRLILGQVGAGFRDLFHRQKALSVPKAESCEIDVVCPQAAAWTNEIRSVARYSISGSVLCTGTLVANTAGDFRNYFLTANHCGLDSANAASVVVYWNYQSPVCGEHGGGSLAQNQSGAVFRAAKADVDFALIELTAVPDPSFNVYYSGWDWSGAAPAGGVGIHHPNADEKSISFSYNPLTTVNSCIGAGSSTHWQVIWSMGVTEPGSSGSGIWDPATHSLVGTLSGGGSDCATPTEPDCYGKLSVAWASGKSATDRLRDWLDPQNTGVTSLPGADPALVPVIAAAGSGLVAEGCSPANGVIDPGETVTVSLALRNGGGLRTTNLVATLLSGSGVAQPSGPQTYGVLAAGGSSVSRSFTFTASGTCGGTITPILELEDGSRNLGTATFSFELGVATPLVIFSENFDGVPTPGLPTGWATSGGRPWVTSTAQENTPPNSAFAADPASISDDQLRSPSIAIGSAKTQLTFRHRYETEDGYDGGVLEISINGGAFTDILAAGGAFVTGGYNQSIPTDYENPLGGRSAWSGNSGGFVTTTVNLPAAAAGKNIQLRWRLGSDSSNAGPGWYVDTVSVSQLIYRCCGGSGGDTAAPSLDITSNFDQQLLATGAITLSGTASDGGRGDNGIASVTVNGVQASNGTASGSAVANWSRAIALLPGTNTITVVATDTAGNATTNVIHLVSDTVRPTVAISSPRAGQWWSNAVFTVKGTARDNRQVASVSYQLNGGDWAVASTTNGWTNWTAEVALSPGTNTVKAYAVDSAGNASPTNRVTFTYIVSDHLILVATGPGTLTPNYSNALLAIGRSYTVTATPGAGYVFSNWIGSELGSTVLLSNAARLSFTMQSNLVLQANIIPNPFIPAKGTYNGLFTEADRQQWGSGFFTLALTDRGAYSGSLRIGSQGMPLSGQFDVAGTASQMIRRPGTNSLMVTMALGLAGDADRLTGTISDGAWVADLAADRVVFDARTNPATRYVGQYTLIIPGGGIGASAFPEGDGYAAITVSPSGNVTLGGMLADGASLSQTVALSKQGQMPLAVSLYGGAGSILSWLTFDTNQPPADVHGVLSWIKPAQSTGSFYPAGFTSNGIVATGSRYLPPATVTTRVIDLTNGVVILEGGNLAEALTNLTTLTLTNKVLDHSLSNKLSLSLGLGNGVFSGSVTPAGTTRSIPLRGALFQNLDAGYGFFLGTNRSGQVYFGP